MYRLLNPLSFAAGQLAVFQGASEVPDTYFTVIFSFGIPEVLS
jgi:hypothetical protein